MSGKFITVCGVDGAGKSSLIPIITDAIKDAGIDLVVTREPGGTPLGEQLRSLLLTEPMTARTEAMLMFAARNEHIELLIKPALNLGRWVLSDRYIDSSYAYQGGARELGSEPIAQLEQFIQAPAPDVTWFFDVPLEIATERIMRNRGNLDRFESSGIQFFQRARDAYLERIAQDPERFIVIDSSRPLEDVQAQVRLSATRMMTSLLGEGSDRPRAEMRHAG